MRILLTTDTVGGVWTYALELAEALAGHDVQIALATMGAPLSTSQAREAARLSNVQVFESDYKLEWMNDPWEDVANAGRWLLDIERQFEPDVVHLNGYAHGALPWQAPTLIVAHSCVLSWWKAVNGCDAPQSWDRYRREVRCGIHSVDMVIAPSRTMLDAIVEHYGAPAESRVIYNGRRADAFTVPASKEPLVLTAGRLWDEAKNISRLASIAPRLDWPVRVAGDAGHPDGGQARPEHVRMLGKLSLDQVAQWFRRAAIYVMPAKYEPFGLTILEAALSGCALVLGNIPSLREIWGSAALFVDPDDPDALAATIQSLTSDPGTRAEWSRRARNRAIRYTPARMAHGYMAVYDQLTRDMVTSETMLQI